MFRRIVVLALAVSPGLALAVSKEIQELQRDVAQLQDMVRSLQRNQDEKFSALQVLVQQSLNAANEASRAVAVIQSGFQQNLRDMEAKVVTPVAGANSRMDQMSNDLRTVSQAVTDLTGQIAKIQAQLTDLSNAVKIIGTPPAPAPPQGGSGASGIPSSAASGGSSDTPPMSASALYDAARRDYSGGKYDLAVQELTDYLRWYGNTELAPSAQYYIARIHAAQGDYETAVKEFDIVLEKYPDNARTQDAMFDKGQALFKLGRRTEGARELQELIKRFPRSDYVPRACEQVKSVGLSCGPRAAASKSTTKRKK
jgi:TolA-binding protein